MNSQTVYTLTANCQDCYRCVRVCPVKAISVKNGQANIQDERCIKCGSCVRECPQNAKIIRSDWQEVKAAGEKFSLVASVAPSFAALLGSAANRLPSALRMLGFSHVSETAEGAYYVTEKSFTAENGNICTACPAVVNYVELYKPELIDALIPVTSPMVAHGRMLKERYPNCKVVFIGPCAAKKSEIKRPENEGVVDYVLTFSELFEWFAEEDVKIENCPETDFENFGSIGDARLFPLQGGMLKTGGKTTDGTYGGVLHLSGADDVISLFSDTEALFLYKCVEPLFCVGGCVGGPDFKERSSLYTRRSKVIDYSKNAPRPASSTSNSVPVNSIFTEKTPKDPEITEKQINAVYEKTGKSDPENRLDCGACGYATCEENAKAVIRGMADAEMCVPHMRRAAKQRTDRIIETSPNGVVILDENLNMITMNPAFQKMFMCGNSILGRNISYLVTAKCFERLAAGEGDLFESVRSKYGIKYHEIAYALRDERQFVGIYSDITNLKFDQKQMDAIKLQTLAHAREFLEHQVRFAQEMAHYLGKSTAQSEEIAGRLISLYEEEGGEL